MNYGSFQSGTEQGLHRNEQPPPTQNGAVPKGKGAVIVKAVLAGKLGLYHRGAALYQPGKYRRYGYEADEKISFSENTGKSRKNKKFTIETLRTRNVSPERFLSQKCRFSKVKSRKKHPENPP